MTVRAGTGQSVGVKPGSASKSALEISGSKPATAAKAVTVVAPGSRGGAPGTAPRSATGTAAPRTGARTGTGQKDAFDALTETLTKKMREKFAPVAQDLESQEAISREVAEFMTLTGAVKPDDLSILEDRIRSKLSGETPPSMTRSIQRKKLIESDDWARIQMMEALEGQREEREKTLRLLETRKQIKEELDAQVREKERRRLEELQEDDVFFRAEEQARTEWEKVEEAKKETKRLIAERLKTDREVQIEAQNRAREMVIATRKREEETLLKATYDEYRAQQRAEADEKARQREMLETVQRANEENKRLKEEEKRKLIEEDILYNKLFEEELAKQERKRQEQLEKMKQWQAKTEKDAKGRAPTKRWVADSVIEKYLKEKAEKDAAREAEDKRRKAERMEQFRSTLDLQIREKREAKDSIKDADMAFAAKVAADVARAKQEAEDKRRNAALGRQRLKEDLDHQMREDASRRRVALMTETERQINKELLDKVNTLRF